MKLTQNKRGAGPLMIILLVAVLIAMVIYWLSGLVIRECSKDTDCPQDNYCGSDFACHEHKIIERTVVHNYNYLTASIITAIGIIIAAIILKSRRIQHILGL